MGESGPTRDDVVSEAIEETSSDLGAVSAEPDQATLFAASSETPTEQDPESDIASGTATAIANDAEPEWVSIDVAAQEPVNDMVSAV